ncbi:MAG TPA: spore coat protein GerQ [Candidatus Aphodocola excrementigallinarum]|uniref:Spore coat protein GerQ n=1 Tax=Candidatus Aphodocola excrementigallinarum TaxID=2840670 RepID=A0A9D1INL4_9FIRM|nr:spore coat protein GerQ [Candidatus Aphodocola excrementigallinarum]
MNTNYYPNPTYPNMGVNGFQATAMGGVASSPSSNTAKGNNNMEAMMQANNNMLALEQSYIENILRLNKGKLATFYFSFPDSVEWRDKTFTGIIEAAGRDHIIVSDPKTGRWYLLLMIYLNYVDFDEKINYSPEYYPQN